MKITLIGAGKLGSQLGRKLYQSGEELLQVFSRKAEKAEALARATHAQACTRPEEIEAGADLYILAVADDAIGEMAQKLSKTLPPDSFLVHTSGSQPSDVLKAFGLPPFRDGLPPSGESKRYGVFYPLQSFSPEVEPVWEQIPFCIYAREQADEELLLALARRLSPRVYRIDDKQRKELHLAAVFANNFTNYLLSLSWERCQQHGIPFELLHPLILETARKATSGQNPKELQTGPAVRGDEKTIRRHLQQLREHPQVRELYQHLTRLIREQKEKGSPDEKPQ